MSKFAYFDPTNGVILDWMDTAAFGYAVTPPAIQLLSLTDDQYAARSEGSFAVKNGELVPYVAPAIPAPTISDLAMATITKVRAMRTQVFATLAGIQSQSLANSDTATAKAISPLQDMLKELPDLDLSKCTTQADIDSAFKAGWAAIVAAAPAKVVSAFNGLVTL